jgi:hypothetical protein
MFEAWQDDVVRQNLYEFLAGHNYQIFPLPWVPGDSVQPLSLVEFTYNTTNNFIAVPWAGSV